MRIKVEKTIEEVLNFVSTASNYVVSHEGENEKFNYAIRKVAKSLKEIIQEYNDEIFNIDLETCSVDEKGNVMRDDKGNYLYNKEGLINKRNRLKELINKKVTFENYIATQIPEDLTEVEIEHFKDFVSDKEIVESEPA